MAVLQEQDATVPARGGFGEAGFDLLSRCDNGQMPGIELVVEPAMVYWVSR